MTGHTKRGPWISCLILAVVSLSLMNAGRPVGKKTRTREIPVFVDSFDEGSPQDHWISDNWQAININTDPRHVRSGSRSMEVTALPGKDAGGMVRVFFEPGYDEVSVRWHCKFHPEFDQGNLMHLNKLIATKEKWAATAGTRPTGFDFFRTTLDVWRDWGKNPPPGEPVFYSYFPHMKKDLGTGKYYGNFFKPKRKILIKPGRWYHMKMRLKANVPGMNNGEQSFWVDGKLIGHFKNITWRYASDLKINSFSIGLFIHDNPKVNRIWYDDIVVSAVFVGP